MPASVKVGDGPADSAASTSPSFLILVIDLNPLPWASSSADSHVLSSLVPSLLVFLNAHLALSHSNGVAVYACAPNGVGRLIYSTASHTQSAKGLQHDTRRDAQDASTYQHFALLGRALVSEVKQMVSLLQLQDADDNLPEADGDEVETALVKVLSMALTHLNRIHIDNPGANASSTSSSGPLPPSRSTLASSSRPGSNSLSGQELSASALDSRILIISSTASASNQYIGLMNCIFASQRRGVPIDVLKIRGEDTVFLQQATNLTGGIYFRLNHNGEGGNVEGEPPLDQQRFLQTLLSTYLPPPTLRNRLFHLPTLDEVDFRASCFCHGNIVDVGYVCGVCLSIFCHPPRRCFICNSRFPKKTLRRYQEDLTAPRPPYTQSDSQGIESATDTA